MSFNLEDMYTTLLGANGSFGAKFDVVQKWFDICKIIDGRYVTEELFINSYERLRPNREELSLVQFVQLLGILARQSKQDVNNFVTRFRTVNQQIIDEIRANIIDGSNVTEDKARKLFKDVADSKDVQIEKFKEAITKLAVEQKKTLEEFSETLAKEGPRFLNAAMAAAGAAASTFKENLTKK